MSTAETFDLNDLHAYVDGQLDPERHSSIEAWLAGNPDAAASVHAYRLQKAQLHEAFDSVLEEGVPPEMEAIIRGRSPVTKPVREASMAPRSWMRLAASFLLLVAGGVGGWLLNDLQNPLSVRMAASFADQAMGAHRVFVSEVKHPVEVPAEQEAHLVAWLSNRLGTPLRAPDLGNTGFELVGGRLLAEGDRPAAQFMYEEPDGSRITVYVRASGGAADTSFRYLSNQGVSAFYWVEKDFAYALVAPMNRERLMTIAQKAYADLGQY